MNATGSSLGASNPPSRNEPGPGETQRPAWRLAYFGSALFGAVVGVEAMIALNLVAPRPRPPDLSLMTRLASDWMRPERDMPIYLGGCALALLLTLGLCWYWRAVLDSIEPSDRIGYLRRAGRLQAWAAAIVAVTGTAGIYAARSLPPGRVYKVTGLLFMSLPAASGFVAAWKLLRTAGKAETVTPAPEPPEEREVGQGARFRSLGAIAAVSLIVTMLYVPTWRKLAGIAFSQDYTFFHHWDFFVVGPALGYLHGRALGTDVYTQYGMAWPLIFAWCRPIIGFDHATLIHVAVLYGCVYFVAYFFLLERLLRDWTWALAGTILAINLCTQLGVLPGSPIWIHPSSTVLRAPMDLWFFLAVLLHLKTGRPVWAFCLGMTVGLGLCFETDTGIYLIGTLAVYLSSRYILSRRRAGEPWLQGSATWPALAGILLSALPVLAIGSRGTILQPEFWLGWIEPLVQYGAGMSALPIAELATNDLVRFGLVAATYLFFSGRLLAGLVFNDAGRETIASGTLAAYGLALLLQFINRSHPYNLLHVLLPFSTLVIWTVARQFRNPRFGLLALALTIIALILTPQWRTYPSVARWIVRHPADAGLRVSGAEVTDLRSLAAAREYAELTSFLAALKGRGFWVGVLDEADTTYYLGSGCPPPDRYSPILAGMIWKRTFEGIKDRFVARRFDFVAMKDGPAAQRHPWDEDLAAIRQRIEPHYERVYRCGSFGIWRRKDLSP